MATVRQTVQELADGLIGVDVAVMRLEQHRDWDLGGELTEAQMYGVEDTPPAGDNSPDQIDLAGHALSGAVRRRLWTAASMANQGTALYRRRHIL